MKRRTCWAVRQPGDRLFVYAVCKSRKQAQAWAAAAELKRECGAVDLVVAQMPRADAVSAVRIAVYDRDNGQCVGCGTRLTFDGAHMHERQSRGNGGVISVENSEIRCFECHEGPRGAHGARRPRFGSGASRTAAGEKQ